MLSLSAARMALGRLDRPLSFGLLLVLLAVFVWGGGFLLAGQAALNPWEPTYLVVLFLAYLFLLAMLVVYLSTEISEELGHNTYLDRESFFLRSARVFLILLVGFAVLFALSYVGPLVLLVLGLPVSLIALYASVIVAIDGYSITGALLEALYVIRDVYVDVFEFIALSFVLFSVLAVLDQLGGIVGPIVATTLSVLIVLPWLVGFVVVSYLRRYPIVVAALRRI